MESSEAWYWNWGSFVIQGMPVGQKATVLEADEPPQNVVVVVG